MPVFIDMSMCIVQYEFRERGIRKTKASLSVSTAGISVVRQKKKHSLWVGCPFESVLLTFQQLAKFLVDIFYVCIICW